MQAGGARLPGLAVKTTGEKRLALTVRSLC